MQIRFQVRLSPDDADAACHIAMRDSVCHGSERFALRARWIGHIGSGRARATRRRLATQREAVACHRTECGAASTIRRRFHLGCVYQPNLGRVLQRHDLPRRFRRRRVIATPVTANHNRCKSRLPREAVSARRQAVVQSGRRSLTAAVTRHRAGNRVGRQSLMRLIRVRYRRRNDAPTRPRRRRFRVHR